MNYKDINNTVIKKNIMRKNISDPDWIKDGAETLADSKMTKPVTGAEAVNNSLQNVIGTAKGTVPGHPEFGCGVDKYIFELIDPFIEEMIKAEIEYAVERWERRCIIQEVKVVSDTDYNRLLIRIIYKIKTDLQSNQHEYIYKQDL